MKTIRWRVEAISAPAALRPCGTCGAEARFESTGRFRVNSQKKRLDVWLIYRCATCGSVWNCAVISCGRPGGIGRERLERFMANDADLALACALDTGLLKSNGARRGRINFVVEGDVPDDGEDCCVQIEGARGHPARRGVAGQTGPCAKEACGPRERGARNVCRRHGPARRQAAAAPGGRRAREARVTKTGGAGDRFFGTAESPKASRETFVL